MKKLFLPLLLLMSTAANAQQKKSFAVHFDLDRYNLTTDASTALDSFVAGNAANTKIKLYGHTDIMAGYEYNDALSEKRTHAVKDYLVKKGFNAANIIEEKGFGKRRPLNSNHGEKEMYENRRVEIIFDCLQNETAAVDDIEEQDEKIDLKEKSLTEKLKDSQATVGKNIVLNNMNFYGGTHTIIPNSLPVLIELVDIMKKNPNLEIGVEGHICCQDSIGDGYDIGTHTWNLSENRAKEICYYLSKNGIASSRLHFKGFGHQQPLHPFPEKTEAERVENRRVEIKILKR